MASSMPADSLSVVETLSQEDTLSQSDTLSDAEIMKILANPQEDTIKTVRDRGRDVSKMINVKRKRPDDLTLFENSGFFRNTFVSAGMTMQLMSLKDHSIGNLGSVSFGKWLHEDHGLKLSVGVGKWTDNYDYSSVSGTEVDLSYLFNISSYAFGYWTGRFCETYLTVGVGYANTNYIGRPDGAAGNAFSCHLGTSFIFRVLKGLDFFIEPQAVVFTDGVSPYAGTWRGWTPAFRATVGLKYNIKQSYSIDSALLLPRNEGYFLTLMAGPHMQNSSLVFQSLKFKDIIGLHASLGFGKYYTDYFAMRYSLSYSKNSWVGYGTEIYPCTYYGIRAEGQLDILTLIRHFVYGREKACHKFLSASLLFGPEAGYMNKEDRMEKFERFYFGLSVGGQVKFRLGNIVSLFLEPRFNIVPYTAPTNAMPGYNVARNYYDALMNFNAGIEFRI